MQLIFKICSLYSYTVPATLCLIDLQGTDLFEVCKACSRLVSVALVLFAIDLQGTEIIADHFQDVFLLLMLCSPISIDLQSTDL